MQITLTKEQYKDLTKMVYLGDWMINAIRSGAPGDELIQKYRDLEQYIFSFVREVELEDWIMFDEGLKRFFPTAEFEWNPEIKKYHNEYDNDTFWEELVHRLAERDFVKHYGEEKIKKMAPRERFEKEEPFLEKYDREFVENGIENLKIKEL